MIDIRRGYQKINSPYCLPYISCNISSENLVVHQDKYLLGDDILYFHHFPS